MNYDWVAGLSFIVLVIALTKLVKFFLFRIPVLHTMREQNREMDRPKKELKKYPPVVKQNVQVGLVCNLVFFILIAPFIVTLQAQSVAALLLDIAVITLIYDFFYYLMHRFLFHGQGFFRRVHALHHQARNPTLIDASYVHPLETFMGISLFMGSVVATALLTGPVHVIAAAVAFVVWTQFNTFIHTYFDVPRFPFRTAHWLVAVHHIHHENMHKGNYSSITLLFDKLFGTLETPKDKEQTATFGG